MGSADIPSGPTTLADAFADVYDHLLTFRIVHALTFFMPRAPGWLRSVAFCLLLEIFVVIATWLGENPGYSWAFAVTILLLLLWLPVLSPGSVYMLDILRRDIDPHLSTERRKRGVANVQRNWAPRTELLFSLLTSVFIGMLTALLMRVVGFPRSPVSYLLMPLMWLVFSNSAVYWGQLYFQVIRAAQRDLQLYPLNPRESPAVQGIIRLGAFIVAVTACFTALTLSLYLFIILGVMRPGISAGLIVLYVMIGAGVLMSGIIVTFILQQLTLSRLIEDRRQQTLNDLQTQISAYYTRVEQLTADESRVFKQLLELQETVLRTGDRAFNFGEALRYLSPLILPLLSLAISTLTLPSGLRDLGQALLDAFSH